MRPIKPSKVILSASKSTLDANTNLNRTSLLRESLIHLEDATTIEVLGMYQGNSEVSFVVESTDHELLLNIGQHFSTVYDQECYLLVHGDNTCEMIQQGQDSGELVGTWTLGLDGSDRLTDFTQIGNSKYYIKEYPDADGPSGYSTSYR